MIIDRVILNNFGLYGGLQVIPLAPPALDQPVILFGGLNGAGKTTLLEAIQLALYGRLAPSLARKGAYLDYLERCIHRGTATSDSAYVEVHLSSISEAVERSYTVRRSWRRNGKAVKEELEVLVNGRLDRPLSEGWKAKMEEMLPVRIAHLFFFDGEQIEAFADPKSSADLLRTAVHSLLGLDIVDQLSTDLVALEQRKRVRELAEPEQAEVDRLESHVGELRSQQAALQQDLDTAQTQLRQYNQDLWQVEQRYQTEGGGLYEKRKELEAERAKWRHQVKAGDERLREMALDIAPLLLVRDLLHEVVGQAELEQNAADAVILTRLLTDRDQEILNFLERSGSRADVLRELGEQLSRDREQRESLAHVSRYLHLDEEARQLLGSIEGSGYFDTLPQLEKLLLELDESRQRIDDCDRLIASIPSDETVQALLAQRETLRDYVEQQRSIIGRVEEDMARLDRDIERERVRYASVLEKVTRARIEHRTAEQEMLHVRRARETLTTFRATMLRRQIEQIQKHILESLKQLLYKETLVADLTISPEDFRVRLKDPEGRDLEAQRLSAGERQLLAVSMLWGLARASGRQLPIIIDTPLGRLDSNHRINLVQRYFPFAGRQVILLSTDEEIDRELHQQLRPHVGHTYRLIYSDQTRSTRVHVGYFPQVHT